VPRLFKYIIFWGGIYLSALVMPLLFAAWAHTGEGRGFWVEFGVALGLVGLAMLALQFALTARFRKATLPFGVDSILQFHRQAGIIAFFFIFAHPIILILADRRYLEFFDPRVNAPRTIFLIVAMLCLLILIVLSIWREKFRLSYEWWRFTHGVAAVLLVGIGLAHALQVGHYLEPTWKKAIWIAFTGVAFYLIGFLRLIKPLRIWRRPWRIAEVRNEPGDVWTLVLDAEGHAGMKHDPGQFVWITVKKIPFALQQHPFSIASCSPDPRRLELTIKELGDWTSKLGQIPPGSRAFLEGPYGTFTLDENFDGGLVFIVGGIGVTPCMSMLRALRNANSRRKMLLIYGNKTHDAIVFNDELEAMQREMDLTVVHVVETPSDDWHGETGFLTGELLDRYLPGDQREDYHYYICGPDPMMDVAENALMDRGVPLWNIYIERFKMV
jgi:predicted ferric reductase